MRTDCRSTLYSRAGAGYKNAMPYLLDTLPSPKGHGIRDTLLPGKDMGPVIPYPPRPVDRQTPAGRTGRERLI